MNFAHPLPRSALLQSRNQALVRLCEGKTVLHLGFVDEGFLEEQLHRHSWLHRQLAQVATKLVGLDISESGVARARQMGFPDCYVANVEKLSREAFPRLNYDIILAADIIEHLANPGLFLGELRAVTGENTIIVLTTPNALSIKTFFFPLARVEAVHPDHNFYYSPTTLTTLLRKYGFQVTETGLYSSIWVRNKQRPQRLRELLGKSVFTGIDAVLRYSIVPLFPYYGEGILVQARKQSKELSS